MAKGLILVVTSGKLTKLKATLAFSPKLWFFQ